MKIKKMDPPSSIQVSTHHLKKKQYVFLIQNLIHVIKAVLEIKQSKWYSQIENLDIQRIRWGKFSQKHN